MGTIKVEALWHDGVLEDLGLILTPYWQVLYPYPSETLFPCVKRN